MEIRVNPEAMGLGAYQATIAAIAILILLVLLWRALRAVARRRDRGEPLSNRELLSLTWPAFSWGALILIAGIYFSSLQAYGPRIAIPKTTLTVSEPGDGAPPAVRDLTPKKLSDEERLEQQRRLEAETKVRVNLDKE